MLILGRKYKFTELEKQRLNKKNHELSTIRYTDKSPQEVIKEIQSLISKDEITTIVLNTRAKVENAVIAYLTSLQFEKNINITSIEIFLEKYLQKCYIPSDQTDLHYLVTIKPFTPWQHFQKRVIDYTSVFLLFFVSWPIMLISKDKIKKQSPGPLLFKQNRVGKNGIDFKCIKFRTMNEDSHHDLYTRENDTRIFKYGETMRKTRIDELPQMWNILRGEMHLIGPRAEWNLLVKNYEDKLPYYHERHLVAPGITGWAQVNYPYGQNIEDTKQKLMYDLYYIKHWNIGLELRIILKTIMVVINKKGL